MNTNSDLTDAPKTNLEAFNGGVPASTSGQLIPTNPPEIGTTGKTTSQGSILT